MSISLYIHIPFCKRKCPYCDFYSIEYNKDLVDLYIDVLSYQLKKIRQKFYTIYIGGGTPTALDIEALEKLLKSLYRFSKEAIEFTVEANPESVSIEKLKLFLKSNVNRISIGVQSFDDRKLKFLERLHTAKDAINSVLLAKDAGFKNINIDLIFGLPYEDLYIWKNDLKKALHLPIKHISTYILTCEKNTKFYKYKDLLDDETITKLYIYTVDTLKRHNFFQYEISNFSKKNFECKHNLMYWENNSYLGLGCGSFSYIDGVRQKNITDIKEYIDRVLKNKDMVIFREKLSKIKSARETIALKIRTISGIDFDWFYKKTNINFLELEKNSLVQLKKDNLIKYKIKNNKKIGIQLTKKGLLFADTVSSSFL